MRITLLLTILTLLSACGTISSNVEEPTRKRPLAHENGKFFEINGVQYMYGGDTTQHFQIDNLSLQKEQFHYGIGREAFSALLNPEFVSVLDADSLWADSSKFLLAYAGDDIKAYSIEDLTRHEIVNDSLNGEPIMAAYCILADLGAVYTRQYGTQTLTFGLSGYTYFDPEVWNGLDGFVFWDRETESLWWPLIGKGVSGDLKDVPLIELDESKWESTTWKTIKEKYPNAQILKSGQNFDRPTRWDKEVSSEAIRNSVLEH